MLTRAALSLFFAASAVIGATLSSLAPAAAQIDPTVLGRAIDAVVQLSIVVQGTVDDEAQLIWYAVGSGTVVDASGLILTNEHLISPPGVEEKLRELEAQLAAEGKSADLAVEADRFMVAISDGRHLPTPRFEARVAAADPDLDLAVLRVESDERGSPLAADARTLPALPLGDSDALNLGDEIHVFGFPSIGSGSLTYTEGVVSGFLFEEEIDGTAWVNTDAVASGGNSGGAAVNDHGELIGVPTSGSALDCRPGDTNHDGAVGPEDIGCVPTGGSLTQLRPIALALPLLASAGGDITLAGGSKQPEQTAVPSGVAASLAAAEGCAARGDWRCAANFYREALAASADEAIAMSLYDAYLALGAQEAAAGRLDSARSAFRSAADIDPARRDATAGLERLAPYRRAIVIDTFDSPDRFVSTDNEGAASRYAAGAFVIEISEPGLVTGFPLSEEAEPLAGIDFAARLRVEEARGDGMVTIETRTDPGGGEWVFAVHPTQQTWEVLQFDATSNRFVPWAGPYSYASVAGSALEEVELRVRDGFPLLLVNGADVAAAALASLPKVGNRGTASFGALMSSEGTDPFTVAFSEIALYELS
jgi:hypothetical protein